MDFLPFANASHNLSMAYEGYHVSVLVALSLVMAILAAFVSLLHTRLMDSASTPTRRVLWHLSGAFSMGLGVWCMHFIGMVSFRIDVPIFYSPSITAVSVLPAMFAAWVTLLVLHRGEQSWSSIVLGGIMMGAGIGAMHYTGMAAIQTQATMLYLPSMFVLSVVVAVLLAVLALASRRALTPLIENANIRLVVCAIIMGFAVASMHYTAMHATVFLPGNEDADPVSGASANLIIQSTLIVAMFIVLLSAVVVLMIHRQQRLESQSEARGEQVKILTERFQSVAERVPGMVYQLHQDLSGHLSFRYLSDAVRELFGTTAKVAMKDAKAILSKVPPDYSRKVIASLNASAHTLAPWNYEFPVTTADHGTKWLAATAMPERLSDGSTSWNGFISDITDKRNSEETIKRLAYYDSLTDLPNRRLLIKEIATALSQLVLTKRVLVVMNINLDGFKRINDVYGQALGDELLKHAATRLQEYTHEDSTLARLTADEFVLVTSYSSLEQAGNGAEILADRLLKSLASPFELAQLRHQGTASVGIVIANNDSVSAEELLRRGDLAVHRAKREGGNCWQLYRAAIEREISDRFAIESDLHKALLEDELELHYQLQATEQGKFFGAEALLRWNHPERGTVSPAQFIPIAEDSSLIVSIGDWVLQKACLQLREWQQHSATQHLSMSVNVSAKQFYQHNFVEKVLSTAASAGITFSALKLELTESLVLEDMAAVACKMQTLRNAGIRFSMDDFGTGYSSLSYLSQLPFDEVKIDQAFIRRASAEAHKRDWVIVQAIIKITNDLGMEVIAEGVETEEQQQRLQASGCLRYQGYYFAKPEPVERVNARLHEA